MNDVAEKLKFDSYSGMSRVPLFWGVPTFPLLLCFVGTLISGIAGLTLTGTGWGGLFASPFLLTAMVLRILCENDDKYLRRLRFMVRRFCLNLRFGRALLITPHNPVWSQYYGRRYAKVRFFR